MDLYRAIGWRLFDKEWSSKIIITLNNESYYVELDPPHRGV